MIYFYYLLSSFMLATCCVSPAQARTVTLAQKAIIENINLEDQTLSLFGASYLLAPETRVINKQNQLLSIYNLQKGYIIEFILSDKENEKNMVTQIKILSEVPQELIQH